MHIVYPTANFYVRFCIEQSKRVRMLRSLSRGLWWEGLVNKASCVNVIDAYLYHAGKSAGI